MNKDQAFIVLNTSFSRGSATWCAPGCDRTAYLAEKSQQLLACVIDPREVTIQGEMFHYGIQQQLNQTPLYAIAQYGENWLLYSPGQHVFSLAFGVSTAKLTVLGFASDDALAEWLG
ncbi:hypothetical protein ACFOLG_06130 [Vogesella facilis]|uniref:Uncharacterized protein n=1 Tax=Vogesella facilis TaxID=1655232 RepID=A0ABV7RGH4_9NEIS